MEEKKAVEDEEPKVHLYSEVEAAKILHIPLLRLQRWRREGRISHLYMSSRQIMYREADLRAFVMKVAVTAEKNPARAWGNAKRRAKKGKK